MKLKFFLLILTVLFLQESVAQEIYRQNITTSEGLPSNTVYDLIQDKNGFIWLATNEGVTRYDGLNFKEFKSKNLSNKVGSHLKIDGYNRVWYETFDGFLYYVENDSVKNIKQEKPVGFYNYVISEKELIFTFKNGIEIVNLETLEKKNKISIPNDSFSYLTQVDDKIVLFDGNKSVVTIDKNKSLTTLINADYLVSPIYFEANNTIYIADKSNSNPNFYRLKNAKLEKIFSVKINATIQNIYYIKNKFWICTTGGLLLLDEFGNTINHYLKKSSITSILIDKDGTTWIGTHNDGIFKIKNFNNLSLDLNNYKPLLINRIDNQIIIGNEYGELYKTDSYFKNLEKINFKATNEISLLNSTHPKYNFIVADGFYQTDKKFNVVSHLSFAVKSISFLNHNEIAFAATGLVGFKKINPKSAFRSDFDSFDYTKDFYAVLKNLRGKHCFHIPKTQKVLFATNNGLFLYEKKTITELKFDQKPLHIKAIENIDGIVLLCSSDEKLYTFKNDQIALFTSNIKKISFLKKTNNELYLISKNKIYKWNQNHFDLINLDVSEKIIDFDSDTDSYYCLLSKSLIKFDKNLENYKKTESKLLIDKIILNGSEHKLESKLQLNYDQNNIEIAFSKVDFSSLQNLVQYKINSSEWKTLPYNATTLQLSALSPDSYEISLKIEGNNSSLQKVVFAINKPIWQQEWFLMSLILFVFTFIILFYKSRIKTLSKKKNLEIEKITLENHLNENRLKLIKAQMNPHFFFNALNTIQSFIATNETEEATVYLDNFSKLTRLILEMTDKNTLAIEEEIKMQKLYLNLQKIRLNDFQFDIKCHPKALEKAQIPTMILQPYIENAIIHGLSHKIGTKKLNIIFEEVENNKLQIKISDNGIGIKKAQEINSKNKTKNASFATKATLERLDIINRKNFTIAVKTNELFQNETSKGTEIIITMNLEYDTL